MPHAPGSTPRMALPPRRSRRRSQSRRSPLARPPSTPTRRLPLSGEARVRVVVGRDAGSTRTRGSISHGSSAPLRLISSQLGERRGDLGFTISPPLLPGGLLRKAQVEEFHVITWNSKKEQVFEMPTAGAAIMREGPNLLKLSRKEQCLALLTQLRTKFKIDGAIYRVFPNGETQYLHPKVHWAVQRLAVGAGLATMAGAYVGRHCL